MSLRKLTDRACKAAKPRATVRYLSDGGGLRLRVRPDGAKAWVLRYTIGGRESAHGLGGYPEVSLEEARKRAADALALVREGRSPSVEKRVRVAHNVAEQSTTFGALAEEWLQAHRKLWSAHYHERNRGLLDRILLPQLAALPIGAITEPMLLKVLTAAYERTPESARRARAIAAQVFAYARDTRRHVGVNPARELARSSLLRKPPVFRFLALQPDQVGPMLNELDESALEPATRVALLLGLLTGVRDGALRPAKWHEFDLDKGAWSIQSARMKSRRDFRTPLPALAVAKLRELRKLTGCDGYVFASYGAAGYLAENTLRNALHGLGYRVTFHGFRSLLTDRLNIAGFNPDWIEAQLDHVQRGVRASYLRTDFFDQRRIMVDWWAAWCEAQKRGEQAPELPANVTPLRRAA